VYYLLFKILVTTAQDGSIKTWKLPTIEKGGSGGWQLNCLFIGHTAKVTSVCEFPYGPCILSSSADGTVRTWSLDTKDEMNCRDLGGDSVLGIGREHENNCFFTFSKFEIQKWKINNVYAPFTVLGCVCSIFFLLFLLYVMPFACFASFECLLCFFQVASNSK